MQYAQSQQLPQPDAASLDHSDRVRAHLHGLLKEAGGRIGFARYMHEVLYARGLGYYSSGATKFGVDGDFTTAPEVSPVFGRIVARQAADVLKRLDAADIIEFGAGTGKLALDVLLKLEELGAVPARYRILEVSADLEARQRKTLSRLPPHLLERVEWLSTLPRETTAVIIANEVLDAMPVERFVRTANDVLQLGVVASGSTFDWSPAPADDLLKERVLEIEEDLGYSLSDGYVSEASLSVPAWIEDLSRCLDRGFVFLFDYGLSRREYYAPDRSDGWLRCHFRHFAHSDPFIYPGIQDVTAWVDFSGVARSAIASGFDIAGYLAQAQFLLGGGLEEEMAGFPDLPLEQQLKLSGQVKTLTLPGEMGENFKCMALSRGDVEPPAAFLLADRTPAL